MKVDNSSQDSIYVLEESGFWWVLIRGNYYYSYDVLPQFDQLIL